MLNTSTEYCISVDQITHRLNHLQKQISSQITLAHYLNVNPGIVNSILSGHRQLDIFEYCQFCWVLNINPYDILLVDQNHIPYEQNILLEDQKLLGDFITQFTKICRFGDGDRHQLVFWLISARKLSGLTQIQLSQQLHSNYQKIKKTESGYYRIKLTFFIQWVLKLGLSLKTAFNFIDEQRKVVLKTINIEQAKYT